MSKRRKTVEEDTSADYEVETTSSRPRRVVSERRMIEMETQREIGDFIDSSRFREGTSRRARKEIQRFSPEPAPRKTKRHASSDEDEKQQGSKSEESADELLINEEAVSVDEGVLVHKAERILAARTIPSTTGDAPVEELYIKWLGRAYRHCEWVPTQTMMLYHPSLVRNFHKRNNGNTEFDETFGVAPEWLNVQRVLSKHTGSDGNLEYLVKWEDLPYSECTWESVDEVDKDSEAIKLYEKFEAAAKESFSSRPRDGHMRTLHTQPEYLVGLGLGLHPYQLDGINWLRHAWAKRTNTILADEMGLGKTIQSVTFLSSLFEDGYDRGPWLVCAPLSTLRNWEREFATWAPQLNVIAYHGSAESRQLIRNFEFFATEQRKSKESRIKFHVLLTSYEMILADTTFLSAIQWKALIVDEAHRLKNNESKFFKLLSKFHVEFRLLLTGTPLQNNLDELFHLLNFLAPDRFSSVETFRSEFADISKEEQVLRLHAQLEHHLLRRVKADVLKDLPTKSEFIVCVDLAQPQKNYYKNILTRNFEALSKASGGKRTSSLLNIMMELKKCCNHLFLFQGLRETIVGPSQNANLGPDDEGSDAWHLIRSSGKLALMDRMLLKLKQDGHRVLVFSQMTSLLDVLEEYAHIRGFEYERIDGSVTGTDRQRRVDAFNAPDATQFLFLLSTRAGGLGINLATADTVIIYDSDWNPHNDIQAFSRAHRIGQSHKVMIYRFVSRNTIEERVVEMAKRKMMLTHLVVQGGLNAGPSLSRKQLDDILKFGTKELFTTDENDKNAMTKGIVYDDVAVETLLDRTREGLEHKDDLATEYLGSFKVAKFETQSDDDEEQDVESEHDAIEEQQQDDDPDYWDKLLRSHFETAQAEEDLNMGKGKRMRKKIDYSHDASFDYGNFEEDDEEQPRADDSEFEGEEEETKSAIAPKKKRQDDRTQQGDANADDQSAPLGFIQRHRSTFLKMVQKFGLCKNWVSLMQGTVVLARKSEKDLRAFMQMFLQQLVGYNEPRLSYAGSGKVDFYEGDVLSRIAFLSLLEQKVLVYLPQFKAGEEMNIDMSVGATFHIADGGFTSLQSEWQQTDHCIQQPDTFEWTRVQDFLLIVGILKHGYGSSQAIQSDTTLNLMPFISAAISQGYQHPQASSLESFLTTRFIARRLKLLERALMIERQLIDGSWARASASDVAPEKIRLNSMIEEFAFRVQKVSPTADVAYAGDVNASRILRNELSGIQRIITVASAELGRLSDTLASSTIPFQMGLIPQMQVYNNVNGGNNGNESNHDTEAAQLPIQEQPQQGSTPIPEATQEQLAPSTEAVVQKDEEPHHSAGEEAEEGEEDAINQTDA